MGVLTRTEITRQLKLNKGESYRLLKSLQKKGVVESTLEYPTRFIAVPFEKVVNSYIKSKRKEVDLIEESKKDLLADWKKISPTELGSSLEKFSVIEGEKKIFQKISQMIKETKNEIVSILSVDWLLRANRFGIFEDLIENPLKTKIKFRVLTQLTKKDLKLIKFLLTTMESGGVKGRVPDLSASIFPRIVIKDNDEILLFISDENEPSSRRKIEAVLCTNCQSIIKSFCGVFQDLWSKSSNIEERIVELETGKPSFTMNFIKDPELAKKKYFGELDKAKSEILFVASPKRLIEISNNFDNVKNWSEKGISVKIMAPITSENLKATQKLLECCEVRHIPVGHRETTIVDEDRFFQFNIPYKGNSEHSDTLNFENVLFTNDLDYIKQTKKSLLEIWKRTHTPPTNGIRLIKRGLALEESQSAHHPILEKRVYNINVKHHQIGVISEKDVLNKIEGERKLALGESGKQFDVMRYFGQRAYALIYPPQDLSIPKMIVGLFLDDSVSASKGQKYMMIDLLQESTTRSEYVPVALIQNTSELLKFRKKTLAGLSVGNNIQVIGKDKFEIQVKGRTLFAGWTVPITLTSKYVLPPACILFEGYGEIKSGIFTSDTPVGRKYEIWYNSLDAFVSFFLPEYKYEGSGTEGYIDIDSVWISKAC